MARTDPREHALIGAAWYAGYLAHAARAGLEAVTLAAVAGPSGIVVAAPRARRGCARATTCCVAMPPCAAPRCWRRTALRRATCRCWPRARRTGLQLWLINLTGEPQPVRLEGGQWDGASLRLIDEAGFVQLARDPAWLAGGARPLEAGQLTLPPYAVAMITA